MFQKKYFNFLFEQFYVLKKKLGKRHKLPALFYQTFSGTHNNLSAKGQCYKIDRQNFRSVSKIEILISNSHLLRNPWAKLMESVGQSVWQFPYLPPLRLMASCLIPMRVLNPTASWIPSDSGRGTVLELVNSTWS